ncbi:MAG: SPOR domain-containing protein [Candidatus Symbiobacter sp.]|nr:SPOR domain-containing protein [Candidatus Symbiobacter sp.]
MAPENNSDLDKEGRLDRNSDRRAGYGPNPQRKPVKKGRYVLGIPLGWWAGLLVLVALVALVYQGYYSLFNQDAPPANMSNLSTADMPDPTADATGTSLSLGDDNITKGDKLNQEVLNTLTSDKGYAPGQEKLQPPPENQNLPPALTDKHLTPKTQTVTSQPPVMSVPLPPSLKSDAKGEGGNIDPGATSQTLGNPALDNNDAPPAPAKKPAAPKKPPNPELASHNGAVTGTRKLSNQGFSNQSWAIQLLAAHKQDAVKSAWGQLQSQYDDVLGTLSLHIEPVTEGDNNVIYRLQAGPFTSHALAKAACDKLAAVGQSCFVIKPH